MKRLSLILIVIFLGYITYYDVQVGTLSAITNTPAVSVVSANIEETDYNRSNYKVTVKQGDTVLSIIEKHHGTLPVSIEQVIDDFESLNPDTKAEAIQIGKTYTFPSY